MPRRARPERADGRVRRPVRQGRHRPRAGHAAVAGARGVGGVADADDGGAGRGGADRAARRDHRPGLRRPRRGHGAPLLAHLSAVISSYGRPVPFAPATELAASIAAREVSAVEVVSAHLDRVSADVNAFTFLDAEGALAAARDPLPGPLSGRAVHGQGHGLGRGLAARHGRPGARRRGRARPTPPSSRGCGRRARSSSARPTALPTAAGSRPTTRSPAGPRTRTTSRARPAGRPAARRRRSRPARRRSGSGPTRARRCGCRRTSAGWPR